MFRYSSRFWLYAPITVFLLIAIAVMAHWKIAADAFEKKLMALKGRDAAPGITLDWDSVAVSGFPFRIDADFTNFSVHGMAARGPFVWKTRDFALHALTYGARKTVYEAAGPQHLEWTGADGAHAADLLPATFHGSSILDGRGLARADLDAVDVGGKGFTARRLQFHMRRDPDGKDLDLMVAVQGLHMPSPPAIPADSKTYITLTRAAPLMPLLAGAAAWPDAARAWNRNGGQVRVGNDTTYGLVFRAVSALY